jgi:hypothetical protein
MKNKYFVMMFLVASSVIYCQNFKFGGGINVLTLNKYLDYEYGLNLFLKYPFPTVPLSIQGDIRFSISALSTKNKYLGGYSRTDFNFGISMHYYPFSWSIAPYIGLGAYYNSNNISQSGMSGFLDTRSVTLKRAENNFSSEVISGVNFSTDTPTNFYIELDYTLNKPEYVLVYIDNGEEAKKDKFNFNSLFLRLGLHFKL